MSLTLLFNKLCISCLRDTCLCLALLRLTATPVLILKLKHIVLQERLQKKKEILELEQTGIQCMNISWKTRIAFFSVLVEEHFNCLYSECSVVMYFPF